MRFVLRQQRFLAWAFAFLWLSALLVSAIVPSVAHAAVNNPQCIEQGGPYECVPVQITAWQYTSYPTISRADLRDWRADCEGRGGTVGDSNGDGVLDCTGAAGWTESNLVPMSRLVAGKWFADCGLTGGESDSGWGYTGYMPSVCGADTGFDTNGSGVKVHDCRWLTFNGKDKGWDSSGALTCQAGVPYALSFLAERYRAVTCPEGYEMFPGAAGCYRPAPCPCANNNPVQLANLNKVAMESDYRQPDGGLEWTRYWNTKSYYTAASGPQNQDVLDGRVLGLGWRHGYDKRLYAMSSSTYVMATIRYPDGKLRFFNPQGERLQAWEEGAEHLTRVVDASNTTLSWRLQTARNEIETYDASGRLVRIEGMSGKDIALAYDASGRLSSATDARGRALQLSYDAGSGLLQQVALPDGSVVSYTRNGSQLTQVNYADGKSRRYGYTAKGELSDIYDETGAHYAHYTYVANSGRAGTVLSTVHGPDMAGGAVEMYQYASDGYSYASFTDPKGRTKRYDYAWAGGTRKLGLVSESCTGCTSRSSDTVYAANGYLDYTTDAAGNKTDVQYDARGLETERIEAANSVQLKRKTQTDWLANWNLPSARRIYDNANALKASTTWSYNSRGQVTLITQTDPTVTPNATRVTQYVYCEQADVSAGTCPLVGLLLSVDGVRADVVDLTSFVYRQSDEATCATAPSTCPYHKGDLWKITNAGQQTTEILKYDGAGRALSIKDPNGIITDIEYDARGRVTARKQRGTDGASETDDRIARIDYWPNGLVKQVTQPDGAYVLFTYDDAQRLTSISDNAGNSVTYTLNAASERIKEDVKDSSGVLQRTLSTTYSTLGQLQATTDAYGRSTTFTYDANDNPDIATDALSRAADNDYDALSRLTRSLQDVNGVAAETKFTYDTLDNVTQVTDPKALNTNYTYNGFGDLTQLQSPDTGTTSYSYDAAGNRKSQTDARGKVTNYVYDALNRLTSMTYPATAALNTTYTYDAAQASCAAGETFSVGRLSKVAIGSDSTTYCYDRFGQVVRKVQVVNAKTFTLRYVYDVSGRLAKIIYPDNAEVTYTPDAQGRVASITVKTAAGTTQTLLSGVKYYPFGPASQWTYGAAGAGGRVLNRTLNQNYQPGIVQDTATGGLSLGYEFDPVGNLKKLRDGNQVDPPQRVYTYDGLNRLTEARDGANALQQGYAYDKTGNRTSATIGAATTTYTYPTTSHRLSAVGANARTYDAAGSATQIAGTVQKNFVYDDRGRMITYKEGTTVKMNYVYDGLGQQVRKYASSTTNVYSLYDEAGHWLGDYNNSGVATQQAIWLGDLPVGVLVGATTAQKLHYIEADALGTPRTVIDPTRGTQGTVVWRWDLNGEAFGTTTPNQNPDGDANQFVFNMRFPGQRFDSASGMNYNYFRDYDAATGRYVESDPVGLNGGISTFGYVGGNALLSIDPYGLAMPLPAGGFGAPSITPGISITAAPAGGAANASSFLGAGFRVTPFVQVRAVIGSGLLGWEIGTLINNGIESTVGSPGEALYDMINPESYVPDQKCPDDENNKRCEKAKSDARIQYGRLVNKRFPQFQGGGTKGRDPGHLQAVIQVQAALRDAIRRIRLYCKPLPMELSEWERVANLHAPGF